MICLRPFPLAVLAACLVITAVHSAPDLAPAPRPVLAGYKTVAQAIKADPKQFNFSGTTNAAPAGWLGVVIGEKKGKAIVDAVAPDSPAEAAGLREGDIII